MPKGGRGVLFFAASSRGRRRRFSPESAPMAKGPRALLDRLLRAAGHGESVGRPSAPAFDLRPSRSALRLGALIVAPTVALSIIFW